MVTGSKRRKWGYMNNVRRETSRNFRNEKRGYRKHKINVIVTNCKNKNIRDLYKGINTFKRDYQRRSNLVNDENVDPRATFVIECA
jgi:hypothetical protein